MFDEVGGAGLVAEDDDGALLGQILLHGVQEVLLATRGRSPEEQLIHMGQNVVQVTRRYLRSTKKRDEKWEYLGAASNSQQANCETIKGLIPRKKNTFFYIYWSKYS